MPGLGLVAPPCQPGDRPVATHPRESAGTLGPAQPFGSYPGARASPAPQAGGLGASSPPCQLPAASRPGSAAFPAGLAGVAFDVLLLGEAFLLFITLLMLPSCQPRASQPALPAQPCLPALGQPRGPCPGRAGWGRGAGVRGLQGPSDLHSCITCLQLLNKLAPSPPPPPLSPLPACQTAA